MASPKKRPDNTKRGKLPKGKGVDVKVIDRKTGKTDFKKTGKVMTNNFSNDIMTESKTLPKKKDKIRVNKAAAKATEKKGYSIAKNYRDAAKTLEKTKTNKKKSK